MKKIIIAILILCIGALGFYGFKRYQEYSKYHQEGFTSGNGRLEATEVSIAAKLAGRLETVSVDEGDYIKKGQTLAMMQLNVLNAKLAQAKAELKQKQSKLLFAEQEKSRYSQLYVKLATASGEKNSDMGGMLVCGYAILSDVQITAENRRRGTYDVTLTGCKNLINEVRRLRSSQGHYLKTADGHILAAPHEG